MVNGKPVGSCRISFGPQNSDLDVNEWISFLSRCFINSQKLRSDGNPVLTKKKATLSGVYIFPIKSCASIKLSASMITAEGLFLDRKWMFVDENGRSIDQKRFPKLCKVQPIWPVHNGELKVHVEELGQSFTLLNSVNEGYVKAEKLEIRVCGRRQMIRSPGTSLPDTLCRFIGVKAGSLVQAKENDSFSNKSPLLLVSDTSVEHVRSRVETSFDISCFRANLVVSGLDRGKCLLSLQFSLIEFEENEWKGRTLQIGSTNFLVGDSCTRCQVICINQNTGEKSREPFSSISAMNRVEGKVSFGVYVCGTEGSIAIGDKVRVL